MPKVLGLLWLVLTGLATAAQRQMGIEQYYYTGQSGAASVVPMVYLQNSKGWFGTARYNYEEDGALSLLGGKTFSVNGALDLEVTPAAGILLGRATGFVGSTRLAASWRSLELSAEPLYFRSAQDKKNNFFYSWTELTCQPFTRLYGGVAVQHTWTKDAKAVAEPGLVLGLSFRRIEFPLYYFNPLRSGQYFVLGVHWNWQRPE